LRDQLEDQLVNDVLPGLGDAGHVSLFDRDEPDTAKVAEDLRHRVEARAAVIVRDEMGSVEGVGVDTARAVGRLLEQRKERFDRCAAVLEARRITLRPPKGLRLDPAFADELGPYVPSEEIDALRRIDRELGAAAIAPVFERLVALFSASVER